MAASVQREIRRKCERGRGWRRGDTQARSFFDRSAGILSLSLSSPPTVSRVRRHDLGQQGRLGRRVGCQAEGETLRRRGGVRESVRRRGGGGASAHWRAFLLSPPSLVPCPPPPASSPVAPRPRRAGRSGEGQRTPGRPYPWAFRRPFSFVFLCGRASERAVGMKEPEKPRRPLALFPTLLNIIPGPPLRESPRFTLRVGSSLKIETHTLPLPPPPSARPKEEEAFIPFKSRPFLSPAAPTPVLLFHAATSIPATPRARVLACVPTSSSHTLG